MPMYPTDSDASPEFRRAIAAYESAISGIPDSFDCLTAKSIHQLSAYVLADKVRPDVSIPSEVDKFVRGHLDMLATWQDELDHLDSELRGNTVAGGLTELEQQFLKEQARALFMATTDLLRAVAEYHHGSAGPYLHPDYGFAYELSNSVVNPFTPL
jgi:hypothetical protein